MKKGPFDEAINILQQVERGDVPDPTFTKRERESAIHAVAVLKAAGRIKIGRYAATIIDECFYELCLAIKQAQEDAGKEET